MAALTPAAAHGPQEQKRNISQKPFIGRDILQRMTQLEQKKRPSPNANRNLFGSRKSADEQKQPAPIQQSTAAAPAIVRSTTAPNLTMRPVEKQTSEASTLASPPPPTSPSLCNSPTWERDSDKKRIAKQEEKDRREREKRQRREEEKQRKEEEKSTGRTGRRLSKKPPAAMDTQRNASALAFHDEPKHQSPNALKERRPSSSGSLASAMRGFLTRRGSSSQSPTPEPSRPTSRLDGLTVKTSRPQSRSSLLDKISSDDDAYVKDLVDFAYQMEQSTQKALEGPSPEKTRKNPQSVVPVKSPILNNTPSGRGQDDLIQSPASYLPSPPLTETRVFFGKKDNAAGGYKYPDFNKLLKKKKAQTMISVQPSSTPGARKMLQDFRSNSSPNVRTKSMGGASEQAGYVQRQRMHQQKGSIVGFEEQMAVKSAVDLLVMAESDFPAIHEDSVGMSNDREKKSQDRSRKAVRGSRDYKGQQQPPQQEETRENAPQERKPKSQVRTDQQPEQQEKQRKNEKIVYAGDDQAKERRRHPLVKPAVTPENREIADKSEAEKSLDQAQEKPAFKATTLSMPNAARPSNSFQKQQVEIKNENSRDLVLSPKTIKVVQDTIIPITSASTDSQKWFELPPLPRSSTSPMFGDFESRVVELDRPAPPEKLASKAYEHISGPRPLIKPDKASKHASMPLPTLKLSNTTETGPSPVESKFPGKETSEIEIPVTNSEGIIRKTSIKRPRSDPEIKVPELKADDPQSELPSLDFLPQLKHQPLPRHKRASRVSFGPLAEPSSANKSPLAASATDLSKPSDLALSPTKLSPPSSFPTPRSSAMKSKRASFGAGNALTSPSAKPIAKMFVICCKCRFWHDLPSRLYEAMALPQTVRKAEDLNRPGSGGSGSGSDKSKKSRRGSSSEMSRPAGVSGPIGSIGIGASYVGPPAPSSSAAGIGLGSDAGGGIGDMKTELKPLEGKIFTQVKCPWCEHGMSTSCCAGWTAIIYLHERHH